MNDSLWTLIVWFWWKIIKLTALRWETIFVILQIIISRNCIMVDSLSWITWRRRRWLSMEHWVRLRIFVWWVIIELLLLIIWRRAHLKMILLLLRKLLLIWVVILLLWLLLKYLWLHCLYARRLRCWRTRLQLRNFKKVSRFSMVSCMRTTVFTWITDVTWTKICLIRALFLVNVGIFINNCLKMRFFLTVFASIWTIRKLLRRPWVSWVHCWLLLCTLGYCLCFI